MGDFKCIECSAYKHYDLMLKLGNSNNICYECIENFNEDIALQKLKHTSNSRSDYEGCLHFTKYSSFYTIRSSRHQKNIESSERCCQKHKFCIACFDKEFNLNFQINKEIFSCEECIKILLFQCRGCKNLIPRKEKFFLITCKHHFFCQTCINSCEYKKRDCSYCQKIDILEVKNKEYQAYTELDHIHQKPLDFKVLLHPNCGKYFFNIYLNDHQGCLLCCNIIKLIREKYKIEDRKTERIDRYKSVLTNLFNNYSSQSGNFTGMNMENQLLIMTNQYQSSNMINPYIGYDSANPISYNIQYDYLGQQNYYDQALQEQFYNPSQGYYATNQLFYQEMNNSSPNSNYPNNILSNNYMMIPNNYSSSGHSNPAIRYPNLNGNHINQNIDSQRNQFNPDIQRFNSNQSALSQAKNMSSVSQPFNANLANGIQLNLPVPIQNPIKAASNTVPYVPPSAFPIMSSNLNSNSNLANRIQSNLPVPIQNPIKAASNTVPYVTPSAFPIMGSNQNSKPVSKIPLNSKRPISPEMNDFSKDKIEKDSSDYRYSATSDARKAKYPPSNKPNDYSKTQFSSTEIANHPRSVESSKVSVNPQTFQSFSTQVTKMQEYNCKYTVSATAYETINRKNASRQCESHNEPLILLKCKHIICKKGVEEIFYVRLCKMCELLSQKNIEELNRYPFNIGCESGCLVKNLYSFDEFYNTAYYALNYYSIEQSLWYCIGFLFDGGKLNFSICQCGCASVLLGGYGCSKKV